MFRRGLAVAMWGLLGAGLWLSLPNQAAAQEPMIYYHYPYKYYPQAYWPNNYRWPDPRIPFQTPPPYMSYPAVRDNWYRYDILENRRYYRGFHFFLDQF